MGVGACQNSTSQVYLYSARYSGKTYVLENEYRPLLSTVPSMGQHDSLDGYITYLQLEATSVNDPEVSYKFHLDTEIAEMLRMYQNINLATNDPLGIGGLLSDACKIMQLIISGNMTHLSDMLLELLYVAKEGLDTFILTDTLRYPSQYRLAFRELGLSIGLKAIEKMQMLIRVFHKQGALES